MWKYLTTSKMYLGLSVGVVKRLYIGSSLYVFDIMITLILDEEMFRAKCVIFLLGRKVKLTEMMSIHNSAQITIHKNSAQMFCISCCLYTCSKNYIALRLDLI